MTPNMNPLRSAPLRSDHTPTGAEFAALRARRRARIERDRAAYEAALDAALDAPAEEKAARLAELEARRLNFLGGEPRMEARVSAGQLAAVGTLGANIIESAPRARGPRPR